MTDAVLLGVDIGTQSTKGVAVTADGTVVAAAERPHDVSRPRPGHFEHDAETVWWGDFVAVVRTLLDHPAVTADAVSAVGVSGIGPCLLPADALGTPLRPAILYGVDTRADEQIAALEERLGEDAVRRVGRTPLTSQAVGPKLLWLAEHEPEVFAATRRLLMASSFLVHRLTGEYVLDHHSASGVAPFYDAAAADWKRDWLEQEVGGLPMPRLLWSDEVAGEVTPQAAAATGLPAGVPVTVGTVDAAAEACSVGVRRPGELMLMYGTTMFLIQVVDELPQRSPLWGTAYLFPGTQALAAGMATSGALTSWFRGLLEPDAPSYPTLVDEAAKVPAGAGGLVCLPYFAGERTPVHDRDARGLLAGLTLDHGRAHLYRALLEATAFGVRHNVEAMQAVAATPSRVVAVGGGTKGALWPEIVSDVTGLTQDLPRHTVGAALGDALLAGLATGLVRDAERWNPVENRVEPQLHLRDRYDTLYAVYRGLYDATAEHQHTLARIGRESL